MKFLDPLLVDGSVLDRYLSRLAENTAQVLSRLEACEQRSELLREELEQVKSSSIQAYKKVDDYENRLTAIQKQLDSRKKSPDSLEQVKSSSIQADKKVDDHEKRLAAIQKKLDSGGAPDSLRRVSATWIIRKVPIEGNFYNDYLKWRVKVGGAIKKGQVIAVCCMSKNMTIEYGSIVAPADGVLIDTLFSDGDNLHGTNIVVGHIQTRLTKNM